MKSLLLATVALLGFNVVTAQAAQVATWGQTSAANTVVATDFGSTQTQISVLNANIDITQLVGNSPAAGVFFNLTAHSIDAAVPVGPTLLQHYSGNFCLSGAANCQGIIFLAGGFTDAALGAGASLVVTAAQPPDSVIFGSDVIPPDDLLGDKGFGLSFTNVSPLISLNGSTIAPFTAAFSGTASAAGFVVPEPMPLAVLGVGLLGLGLVKARRRTA